MAYFKLITFNGLAPQVAPRLLADGIGQTATNTDLDRGVLTPTQQTAPSLLLTNKLELVYIDMTLVGQCTTLSLMLLLMYNQGP